VKALCKQGPFVCAWKDTTNGSFSLVLKNDHRFALFNQFDTMLLRVEQERLLRASALTGLRYDGLELAFHGFTRLLHTPG
jgi:hypothetical protein